MTRLLENYFKKMPLFEYLAISILPLFLYKYFFYDKFNTILILLKSSFKNFDVIIEFVFFYLLIMSVLIVALNIFISIIYNPVSYLYSIKFKKNENEGIRLIDTYYKFFYGTQNRTSILFRWLWLTTGYFYLIYPRILINFVNQSLIKYKSLNYLEQLLLYIPGFLYFILLLMSLYVIFHMVIYEFLYLKTKPKKEDSN